MGLGLQKVPGGKGQGPARPGPAQAGVGGRGCLTGKGQCGVKGGEGMGSKISGMSVS